MITHRNKKTSHRLRTAYEEDPLADVTQIALWQAYQDTFIEFASRRALLSAKDFITNVSNTFVGATAQVITTPVPKYTIKGIRPRTTPVDPRGQPYLRCRWRYLDGNGSDRPPTECGAFAWRSASTWDHVVETHLGLVRDPVNNRFVGGERVATGRRLICRWAGCRRFEPEGGAPDAFVLAMHLKMHMSDGIGGGSAAGQLGRAGARVGSEREAGSGGRTVSDGKAFLNTQTDERNDAAGLPLASVLVLRNLARAIRKFDAMSADKDNGHGQKGGKNEGYLLHRVFGPVREQLFHVVAVNLSLREYMTSLMMAVTAGD